MKHYYSIDIGGTFTKFAYLDEHANFLSQWKIETPGGDADAFYDCIANELTLQVDGIGVCAPGIFDPDGLVLSAVSGRASVMYRTNPILEIQKRIQVPVSLINDAKACGLCELTWGNAKNSKRSAVYVIGTGIGGCLMDQDGIITGANGFSGEFSYMPIYEKKGIGQLGNHASMTALLHSYNQNAEVPAKDTLEIMSRYQASEEKAIAAVNDWLNAIAMQLITIHSVYDPEVICIGGAISSDQFIINQIKTHYQQLYQSFISSTLPDHTRIISCKYQNEANLIGAYLNLRKEIGEIND